MNLFFAVSLFTIAMLSSASATAQRDEAQKRIPLSATVTAGATEVTVADLVGTYERFPVENDLLIGEIKQNGDLVRWTNRMGLSIDLTPDLANQRLLPATYEQSRRNQTLPPARWVGPPQPFTLIVSNGQVEGFIYDGAKFTKLGFVPSVTALRFVDNGNGTVTDNQSGLIWLKDAKCADLNRHVSRDEALKAARELQDGMCGLTDNSKAGNWRLPTAAEFCGSWQPNTVEHCQRGGGLIDTKFSNPALSNAKGDARWTEGDIFTSVVHEQYRGYHTSSPTQRGRPGAEGPLRNEQIWRVFMQYGLQVFDGFPEGHVWPVRR